MFSSATIDARGVWNGSGGRTAVRICLGESTPRYPGSPRVCTTQTDKRVLVYESEFASVLKMPARDGNTLSEVLRRARDGVHVANAD